MPVGIVRRSQKRGTFIVDRPTKGKVPTLLMCDLKKRVKVCELTDRRSANLKVITDGFTDKVI